MDGTIALSVSCIGAVVYITLPPEHVSQYGEAGFFAYRFISASGTPRGGRARWAAGLACAAPAPLLIPGLG